MAVRDLALSRGASLKKIIIVRHGEYDREGHLNANGEFQMVALANILREKVNNKSIVFISSSAPRAIESSKILAKEIGVEIIEEYAILWSDSFHHWSVEETMQLLKEKGINTEIVIVVTHLEYCDYLPMEIAETMMQLNISRRSIPKGGACICDFENKIVNYI